ncbi:hypothetical protein A6U89_28535 [Agrobacterium sp. B133/95]|nr:hypothetical protein A6U89_28535 [Agrobacterium sp. B133/95]
MPAKRRLINLVAYRPGMRCLITPDMTAKHSLNAPKIEIKIVINIQVSHMVAVQNETRIARG